MLGGKLKALPAECDTCSAALLAHFDLHSVSTLCLHNCVCAPASIYNRDFEEQFTQSACILLAAVSPDCLIVLQDVCQVVLHLKSSDMREVP